MEFASPTQQACYERVAGYLREIYGERLVVDGASPAFGVREGSAWVNVSIRAPRDGGPVVVTRAWVVGGTDLTPAFLHSLLAESGRPELGAYGLDGDDDVYLEHALPGQDVTLEQVRASVTAVALEADRADDAIVARFGGIRMTDKRV
jgi:hypothetical protein